ncbi:NAD(P)-dependent dehydrogenase, short-chain alcohol dehydrogenase family [Hymenobacter daecheongensis DSM 21074]|uniref:NAD(P)-dependent dehydrogenase, short-chain alcohol dehydrogenase family n=1 Tax=Hymenobacter daecheongensis DSM 21074 TaxID=1121955 RepID=A0A1M6A735_9BACT|nr:SDR family oxidoreductase [Hymenobacter daecheongensis]SHI32324.1 NAD(P)-dependent dehydrogenase, short-chain alcohol dehydrogenase family [Hymenobacter daecheongensis DSM 21074]
MSKRFQDKVCLVTGGTSGIGRAVAGQLGREGGRVAVLGRNAPEGREVVREIEAAGGEAVFIRTDVGKDAQLRNAVDRILARWQRIDVLINDAAMMTFTPILKLDPKEWDQLMTVNVRALFRLCQLCLPHMQGGSIVTISSVHAHQTTPNVVPYAASKGAMEAFVRGISLEIPHTQARINAVAPGAVDTPMLWENPNVKSGKEEITGQVGTPAELAAAICFLASPEANFINGTTLVVDGGRLAAL